MNDLSIFDSLFNDVLGTDVAPVLYHTGYGRSPKVNICEEENAYTLEMELPGRTENDIDIELNHNTLTISSLDEKKAEKKEEKEDKKRKYIVKECHKVSFSRSFTLPEDIDEESISASFKNGILTIDMKKKAQATPKKIAIAAN